MSNVIQFRSNTQILEDGKIQKDLNELDDQIEYLTNLITNTRFKRYEMFRRFKHLPTRHSTLRIEVILRKELGILKGIRTKLAKKLENIQ